jgi:hypothetical protein
MSKFTKSLEVKMGRLGGTGSYEAGGCGVGDEIVPSVRVQVWKGESVAY